MNFQLSHETAIASSTAREWAAARMKPHLGLDPGTTPAVAYDNLDAWRSFLDLGLLGAEQAGGTLLDEALAVTEAVRFGLPGPVLEADLALATGNQEAAEAISSGRVVSSARAERNGDVLVAWGAHADLIVDQSNGQTLARERLPRVSMSHPLPHGWLWMNAANEPDRLAGRRWLISSALLVGLATGAVEMAAEYARNRIQFGRPIGDRQAIQLRMAEAYIGVWGARQAVLDAAWRASVAHPEAEVAAALCWLWTEAAARRASRHSHQAFGALGFCEEAGLVRLTSQIDWLCMTIGRRTAERVAVRDRVPDPTRARTRVLEGYSLFQ